MIFNDAIHVCSRLSLTSRSVKGIYFLFSSAVAGLEMKDGGARESGGPGAEPRWWPGVKPPEADDIL